LENDLNFILDRGGIPTASLCNLCVLCASVVIFS
jgi:hypothetical protein